MLLCDLDGVVWRRAVPIPGSVDALNDLVSCYVANPGEAVAWADAGELQAAFRLFTSQDGDDRKAGVLQGALGLDDAQAARLKQEAAGGLSLSPGGASVDEELELPF